MSDGDILIPVLTVLIAAFGVLMVYSASSYTAEATYGDAFFFAKKQLLGFVLGTVGMIAVSFFPYTKLQKLKWAALGVSVVLLAVLFIPGVGKENYGATRWINLGPLTIQPSEIAKYGFVIFAASYMSEKPERMKTFVGMLPVLGAGGGICLLVILEPNMSITMCIGLLMIAMLFLGGAKFKNFLFILIPALLAVPVLIAIEPYRLKGCTPLSIRGRRRRGKAISSFSRCTRSGTADGSAWGCFIPARNTAFCPLRNRISFSLSSGRSSVSSGSSFSLPYRGFSFTAAYGRPPGAKTCSAF